MRASRWFSALCIMCGALLFATATALWPTRAYADTFQIDLSESRLRIYDCYTSVLSDETLGSDISGYAFAEFLKERSSISYQDQVSLAYGNNTVTGYIYPDEEYTDVYWKSAIFDGANEALNNPPLVLYIPLGSTVLPKGYKFRISFSGLGWTIRYQNGSNYQRTQFNGTVYRAFSGTSLSDLQECTYSAGGYVAAKNSRVVALVLQTTNRTGARLIVNHQYYLYSQITMQIDLPDATAQVINDQSIINTEDINEQSQQNTQEILYGQQEQTDALKDTTGSNTIVGPATTQGQNVFENLSLVTTMEGAFENINQAISTQDSDTGIPFPGMSMAGFVIPAYNVDPTQMMPEIMPYVKGMLTFVFCCAFLSHIVHLIQAIFGIYDYGEMVFYDDHTMPVSPAVNTSYRPDYNIDEDLGF